MEVLFGLISESIMRPCNTPSEVRFKEMLIIRFWVEADDLSRILNSNIVVVLAEPCLREVKPAS
jgi:hypothetical protein